MRPKTRKHKLRDRNVRHRFSIPKLEDGVIKLKGGFLKSKRVGKTIRM